MTNINCPYCEAEQYINHDDGYGYREGEFHTQECSECRKVFAYDTAIIYHHSAWQASCLNGGEHKLRQVKGYPEAFFVGVKRCELCGEEVIDKEANKAAIARYIEECNK